MSGTLLYIDIHTIITYDTICTDVFLTNPLNEKQCIMDYVLTINRKQWYLLKFAQGQTIWTNLSSFVSTFEVPNIRYLFHNQITKMMFLNEETTD